MAGNDKPERKNRQVDTSMQSIAEETVKFANLLDRPIVIIERERRNGQFGDYDQWLVDTGDKLVYTSPHARVAAEYRKWQMENPGQPKRCVITGLPNEKGYLSYRWETWNDDDMAIFMSAKESSTSQGVENDGVPF